MPRAQGFKYVCVLAAVVWGSWLCYLFSGILWTAGSAIAASELFFSEYVEGSSNNKALEIFNGTSGAIDLAAENYDVQFFFNGNSNAGRTIPLTGTVAAGDVYILAHSNAAPAILSQADQTTGGSFFNGDDAVALRKNGVIIDVIGQIGVDPGSRWGSNPTSTQNNTLRRKPDIQIGDSNGSDPFDPALEWDGFAADTFDGLGFHTISPPADTPPSVVNTTPANDAVDVALDAGVTISFSEPVTVTANWFQIGCNLSGTRQVSDTTVTAGPITWMIDPTANFAANETCTVTVFAPRVTDQDGPPDPMAGNHVFTFTTALPPDPILISEFVYDGLTPSTEGDEFVELCNPNPTPVNLTGYKIGDEETAGGNEGMYLLPDGYILAPDACLLVAKNAAQFQARFGIPPDFEAGNLAKYTAWGSGNWSLANSGDELLVLGPGNQVLDSVAYGNGNYTALGLLPDASAAEPQSLQRIWPRDTNAMPDDFVRAGPTPGNLTPSPSPPATAPQPAALTNGMYAYWGHLHAHTTYSDGAGPPFYALDTARAAGLHFYAITDHGWRLSAEEWAKTLTQTITATVPGRFVALRGQEWTLDTVGHINVFNTATLLQRTNPGFDTLPEMYAWLAANPGVVAQFNHPDAARGGNFNNFAFNAAAAPQLLLQEMGNHAQGYATFESAFIQSNAAGWRVAPTNNGDTHTATWGTDTIGRTGLVAAALTPADLLAALQARRVFSTEDNNLALALRSNTTWMGSELPPAGSLPLTVEFADPDPEPLTLYLFDSNLPVAAVSFSASTGQWDTSVNARPGHYFWAKAVQADGNTAYTAPLWIAGQYEPETIFVNEILPAPGDRDWDGNGVADYNDEWLELYNPLDRPVGLGGWRLFDEAGVTYNIPSGVTIPARGYATFYFAQTNIGLNNDGDTITLAHPNGTQVDVCQYTHSPGYDGSWCRQPDGSSNWRDDCEPSPNGANRLKEPPGPLQVSIYDAKHLAYDAWVRVKGRVTAPPGLLGSRTMYIQDETAGIKVYLPQEHRLAVQLGDRVMVTGHLRSYYEEWEIVVDERSDVKTKESGFPPPALPVATTSLLEPYEGRLVMLQGRITRFKGRATLWVDDGTGPAKVYIRHSTGITRPYLQVGTPLTVVGIASQYANPDNPTRDDYRLLPRYQTDLLWAEPPPPANNWPLQLPETGRRG